MAIAAGDGFLFPGKCRAATFSPPPFRPRPAFARENPSPPQKKSKSKSTGQDQLALTKMMTTRCAPILGSSSDEHLEIHFSS
jgi:hypothetical protein